MNMNIGENIKKKRVELNLSQDELAEKMFMTRQTISNYEIGKRNPSIETLQQLATIFQCDLEELLYGKKQETKGNQKKYLIILLGILILYILLMLLSPKIKVWQGLSYRISAIYVTYPFFILPLMLGTGSYCMTQTVKNNKLKYPKFLRNKYLHYVLLGTTFIFVFQFAVIFTSYAISNLFHNNSLIQWTLKNPWIRMIPYSTWYSKLYHFFGSNTFLYVIALVFGILISLSREEV